MKKVVMLPVTVSFCDICGDMLGQKSGDSVVFEPNDPLARVECCRACARKRGYIA